MRHPLLALGAAAGLAGPVHSQAPKGKVYQGDTLDEVWPTPRRMTPPYGLAETPKPAAGERLSPR